MQYFYFLKALIFPTNNNTFRRIFRKNRPFYRFFLFSFALLSFCTSLFFAIEKQSVLDLKCAPLLSIFSYSILDYLAVQPLLSLSIDALSILFSSIYFASLSLFQNRPRLNRIFIDFIDIVLFDEMAHFNPSISFSIQEKGLVFYTKKDFSGLARVLALQDLCSELGS